MTTRRFEFPDDSDDGLAAVHHFYRLDDEKNIVPCSLEEWSVMIENNVGRTVGKTAVGPLSVSTVFLGLPHPGPEGFNYFFETMIFGSDETINFVSSMTREHTKGVFAEFLGLLTGQPVAEFQVRYKTWHEASEGHRRVVELCKQALALSN